MADIRKDPGTHERRWCNRIGKVLDALSDAGKDNNTVVVFTSDNGPTLDQWPDSGYSPFRGGIGTAYEGGVRVPCIFRWPGSIEAASTSNEIVSLLDLFSCSTGRRKDPHG